jgi:hypothetical protein
MDNSLKQLFDRYVAEREKAALNLDTFQQMLYIFPAVLIAQADGHIDTTEMIHINKLAQFISSRLPNVDENELKQELRYLTWNAEIWRLPILKVLKDILDEESGSIVVDLMISTASSSTGSLIDNIFVSTLNPATSNDASQDGQKARTNDFICEEERDEIILISRALGFLTNESLRERISKVVELPID